MRVTFVTIFPDMIREFLKYGLIRHALDKGLLETAVVDLRDFSHDKHRSVDDTPFGGGAGMVIRPEPVFEAVGANRRPGEPVILLTPQGAPLTHSRAAELSRFPGLLLLCGRYEGIDERVRSALVDKEVSIGDYITMGGELPALVLLEAVARLLPGVVGNETSVKQESFFAGLLDFPQYTRPAEYRNMKVPEILLSGNHPEIERWRRREALRQTLLKRPDLLEHTPLSEEDRAMVDELKSEAAASFAR